MSTSHAAPAGTVVAAVDDSSQSRTALAWAASYARATGVALHAVHVLRYDYGYPESWAPGLLGAPNLVSTPERDLVRAHVQDLFDDQRPESDWTLTFLDGVPGAEVVRFAAQAALLVVGTREHQGFERLVAGSVSHYCLNHAECPMATIPDPPEALVPAGPVPDRTEVHA